MTMATKRLTDRALSIAFGDLLPGRYSGFEGAGNPARLRKCLAGRCRSGLGSPMIAVFLAVWTVAQN